MIEGGHLYTIIAMGVSRSLAVAFLGLVCILMLPANAVAKLSPGSWPEECTFEDGDLGRYIVVFQDWVEDPGALAQQQAKMYGGNLGFVYKSALKGYSAEFPPPSAEALQAEPTVKSVQVDRLIWMDDSSGVIQWYSCPLAPPLGPAPPSSPDPPEGSERSGAPDDPAPPGDPGPLSPEQGGQAAPHADRCKARIRTGKRCGPTRDHIDRKACKKRKVTGKRRCSRDA